MPRFLSPEWAAAVTQALAGVDLGSEEAARALSGSLAAGGHAFRVCQVVHGAPPGDAEVRTTLRAVDGRLTMEVEPPDGPGTAPETPPEIPPDVTISLSYADAAALAKGDLDPAAALAQGRVLVRGDFSLLVASQALLATAADRLSGLYADTTY